MCKHHAAVTPARPWGPTAADAAAAVAGPQGNLPGVPEGLASMAPTELPQKLPDDLRGRSSFWTLATGIVYGLQPDALFVVGARASRFTLPGCKAMPGCRPAQRRAWQQFDWGNRAGIAAAAADASQEMGVN